MSTEEIWNQFRNELHGFILSRVSDKDVADDLLQEIFIKIHLKKDTLQESSKLTSWVYQIARNTIIDHYRKGKAPEDEVEQLELPPVEELEKVGISFNQCIRPFIDRLEPKYKDALVQTSFGNISQKEYARKLDISYSGAKSRIQRARQMVKDQFMACCPIVVDKYGNIVDPGVCGCDC